MIAERLVRLPVADPHATEPPCLAFDNPKEDYRQAMLVQQRFIPTKY